jgi:hypothetical protein
MPDTNEFNAAFFDDASAAWRSNKIARNQGMFNYCCQHVSGTRKKICGKKVYVRGSFISTELLCWTHCRSNKPNDASTSSTGGSDES